MRIITALLALLLAMPVFAETPTQDKQVYIVHGYSASPDSHWFAWLKQRLQSQGVKVSVLDMPNSAAPRPDQWQQTLQQQVIHADRNTWFVTHSLGSIAVLRYLADRQDLSTIGGIVLVSGFNEHLSNIPELDPFLRPDLDYAKIIRVTHTRMVIAAANDVVVPAPFSQRLARQLDAQFVLLPEGGHFLKDDGYSEFPALLNELERLMRQQ